MSVGHVEFQVVRAPLDQVEADIVAVPYFQGVDFAKQAVRALDGRLGGPFQRLVKLGDYKGRLKETRVLPAPEGMGARRVMLLGLGKPKEFKLDAVREAAARAALVTRDHRVKHLAIRLLGVDRGILPRDAAQAMVEGIGLGLFEFRDYKPAKPRTEEEEPHVTVERVTIVIESAGQRAAVEKGVAAGRIVVEAVNLARTLITRPSIAKWPQSMAEVAQQEAKKAGVSCEVFDEAKLAKLGMGALLGVGSGSARPPRLVVLEYKGGKRTVLLCGKGITFDSGGINIKPSEGMDRMKYDMAGSATVLATILAAARLKVKAHVVAIMALAENMPSGTAIRPGDVLKAYNGKTIEVGNTDAEGRLVLADALSYGVERFKPDHVVDIATLTGAARVALGNITTAVMGNDEGLVRSLIEAGKRSGDDLWQLPLHKGYEKQVQSDIAEVKNVGVGGTAGCIAGGAFLKAFVGDRKWAHLDIAGTCWTDKGPGDLQKEYLPKGPTGIGVRLFLEWLQKG